jgi:L-cysteine desulfidase
MAGVWPTPWEFPTIKREYNRHLHPRFIYVRASYAIKNMIAHITGVICEHAKPSRALKIAGAISAVTLSALMAMKNEEVAFQEGIIYNEINQTIRNLICIVQKEWSKLIKSCWIFLHTNNRII